MLQGKQDAFEINGEGVKVRCGSYSCDSQICTCVNGSVMRKHHLTLLFSLFRVLTRKLLQGQRLTKNHQRG